MLSTDGQGGSTADKYTTTSTGTVHTSAKARITSAAIWQISISGRFNHFPYLLIVNRHTFNSLFSRTTCLSQHQKDQTILDFNEARGDRVAAASAEPHENHLHPAPDR